MIFSALSLGFSTGIFCLGYCYPVLGPLLLSREKSKGENTIAGSSGAVGLFLLGRFIAYVLFGAVAGLAGKGLRANRAVALYVIPGVFVLLGLSMVSYGVFQNLPHLNICQLLNRHFRHGRFLLLMGFLAGINLCPPFLLAVGYVLNLGEVWRGMLFFVFFFLATSVFLIPFFFSGLLSKFHNVRVAARLTAVAAGLWFVYLGLSRFW
jgi:sulfite exporter TauE/SafE